MDDYTTHKQRAEALLEELTAGAEISEAERRNVIAQAQAHAALAQAEAQRETAAAIRAIGALSVQRAEV
ncbi:hypothetical protein NN3_34810 [Nocardia neocaledoniensis NBRC 108232]|uniref:Uncharacterized protein n=1 Tax=Nocardia neocaledoniensis TaxID=236511 RepID=A0A317NBB1_9NOCA|nr:hypothetical protein [Nocardia neocaledoniensis]PWV72203.1 hypothetical protein DFR69_109119 [Nocardia neocaledoniensis]GEM32474.1 hypothetical protein NN3_34810 [Nocardia neocaledoniensis NBRC 108232]